MWFVLVWWWLHLLTFWVVLVGQEAVILVGILLDRVRQLVLRREVLELRPLRQRVRLVGPKFLLVGFRVQILNLLGTVRDSR